MKVAFIPLSLAIAAIIGCGRQPKPAPVITSDDYQRGASLLEIRNDSAYYYFNKVVTTSKDSLQVALAYNNMAIIQNDAGDYYDAQETVLESLRLLHEERSNDQYCEMADYNVLGNISLNLKNYDAAIDYYGRAAALAKEEAARVVALNNKAVAYRKKGQYAPAIAIYESILPGSRRSNKEYARVVTNLATVRWMRDPSYLAAPELTMALQLRKQENDEWGLNSSYAHLADYYASTRPDSALLYANEMYKIATRLASPDDRLEALQKLITLGPAKEARTRFAEYQQLSDSLQMAHNSAKNQLALIRYEADKNKKENQQLQQDNTEKRLEIFRWWIIFISCLLVFGVIISWLIARHRNHTLKTSRKVHDVVANGIYVLMKELQYSTGMDQDKTLDKLEVLYEQSRNISYDGVGNEPEEFHMTIGNMLTSFSRPGTRVLLIGNDKVWWDAPNDGTKRELKEVLRELMINMDKHSGAANVVILFERADGDHSIRYTDDGVGFVRDQQFGNGLTNTGNRIRELGGRITFDRNTPKGLKIEIRISNRLIHADHKGIDSGRS